MNQISRCSWPGEDPLYQAYHDEEWGVPVYDDRALFEKLILDGFQAGLSWITILRKRDHFFKAFDGFDPFKMIAYGPEKIESLMQDSGIIRNRLKIASSVTNAQTWLKILEKRALFRNSSGNLSEGHRFKIPGIQIKKFLLKQRNPE